ncbi:MAG: Holliday junction branch migration protein RuvA [Rickettsiaceae bacterium H1]|nr:Holliday junction branch migration protein RuvA [Rickettsiaceae bacterium H1]
MIGKLCGVIDEIESDHIILNVNDVGYIVYVTMPTLQNVKIGENILLFIETYLREDQLKLYGFKTKKELSMLKLLIKVKGVSHKIATNIISEISSDQIIQGISGKNPILLKASGVGIKLANRIIVDLEGKIMKEGIMPNDNLTQDAVSALINLGYNSGEAYRVVNEARNEFPEINEINKLMLKVLKKNEKR